MKGKGGGEEKEGEGKEEEEGGTRGEFNTVTRPMSTWKQSYPQHLNVPSWHTGVAQPIYSWRTTAAAASK